MKWIILIASILNLFLGILVWTRNPKKSVNKYFGIFGIITSLWVFNNFLFRLYPDNNFIIRNSYALGAFVPVLSLFWVYLICDQKLTKKDKIIFLLTGSIFFILSHIDGLIIKEVEKISFAGFKGIVGPLFWLYSVFIFGVLGYIFYKIYSAYRKSKGVKKIQLNQIAYGVVIWIYIVLTVSFLLPLFGNIDLTSFDSPSSLIFVAFTAFAIIKYRFLDIRAIIFRSIAFGFILLLITSIFAVTVTLISSFFAELAGVESNILAGLVIAVLVTTLYLPVRNLIEKITNTFLYKQAYNPDLLLSNIREVASSTLDLRHLLKSSSNILESAFNCEKIKVALIETKKSGLPKLAIAYEKGFETGAAEKLAQFPGVVRIMYKHFKEYPGIQVIDELYTKYENGEYQPISVPLLQALHDTNIAIIVPLLTKEKLIGILVLGTKKSGDPYNTRDIQILNIISGILAIAIDNAQIYGHLEELVEERTEELGVANEKLESANVELKKLDAAKSEFISIASHQLRSPLTAIKGYISMMKDGDFGSVPQNLFRYLDIVYTSNERLIALVNDLLNISRIESGRQRYDFKENDLGKIAEEIIVNIQPRADEKKLKLIFEKPKVQLSPVVCDGEKIHEVMMNLIDNAVKYTKSGSVWISLKAGPAPAQGYSVARPEGMVTFSVKDTGMGITKENMPHLFKKFSRGEGTFLVQTEGTGLGLYVAKMIVQVHEGKIWAESEGDGKGSTFLFSIPIAGPKKLPLSLTS